MAVLKIAEIGNPCLKEIAQIVSDPQSIDTKRLIQDLWDTKDSLKAAGLAAPQIHASARIIVMGLSPKDAADTERMEIPKITLINPGFQAVCDETSDFWEASFSVPGYRGIVPRYTDIRYWGSLPDGSHVEIRAKGYHARLFQHEYDHLDGILYTSRIIPPFELVSNGEFHHWAHKRLSGDPRYNVTH